MNTVAWAALVAGSIFALSVAFYAGILTQRISALEQWRLELRSDFAVLMASVADVKAAVGARRN